MDFLWAQLERAALDVLNLFIPAFMEGFLRGKNTSNILCYNYVCFCVDL